MFFDVFVNVVGMSFSYLQAVTTFRCDSQSVVIAAAADNAHVGNPQCAVVL